MKLLNVILISLLISGCFSESDDDKDKTLNNKTVYADNFIWTFNKALIITDTIREDQLFERNILKIEFDKQNRPEKINWVRKAIILNMVAVGYDIYEIKFDYPENKMIQTYLDQKGEPSNDFFGISKIVTEFDSLGNKISESYFDKFDKPAKDDFGYIKYEFFESADQKHKYSIIPDSVDQLHYILDKRGVVKKIIWKDDEQNIKINKQNYAASVYEYEKDYKLSEIRFLDKNDSLCSSLIKNSAMIHFYFNDETGRTYLKYLDIEGAEIRDPKCKCSVTRNFLPPSGDINYFYSIRELKD